MSMYMLIQFVTICYAVPLCWLPVLLLMLYPYNPRISVASNAVNIMHQVSHLEHKLHRKESAVFLGRKSSIYKKMNVIVGQDSMPMSEENR